MHFYCFVFIPAMLVFVYLLSCPFLFIYIVLIRRSHADYKYSMGGKQDLCSKMSRIFRGPESILRLENAMVGLCFARIWLICLFHVTFIVT